MVDFNIENFSNALGSRQAFQKASHFQVTGCGLGADQAMMIKAATFPASTIGFIEVPFRGRKIKIPGDRTFAEWQISVYQDGDNQTRETFIEWSNEFEQHEKMGAKDPEKICTWTIDVLDSKLEVVTDGTIELVGCFPIEIGPLDFSYESVDTILQFDVSIGYDYWTSEGTKK